MLPPQLTNTARRAIAVALAERRDAVPRARAQIFESGALRSSRTMLLVRDLVANEYLLRAQLAWQTWLRALATQSDVVTTDLRTQLLAEIERVLDAESQDLPSLLHDTRVRVNDSGTNVTEALAAMRGRALEWAAAEVDFAILEATSKHAKGPERATFNFYGTVGAVLTGPGAAASVTITADQRHSVINALTVVKQAVAASPELEPAQREQLTELVGDATTHTAGAGSSPSTRVQSANRARALQLCSRILPQLPQPGSNCCVGGLHGRRVHEIGQGIEGRRSSAVGDGIKPGVVAVQHGVGPSKPLLRLSLLEFRELELFGCSVHAMPPTEFAVL